MLGTQSTIVFFNKDMIFWILSKHLCIDKTFEITSDALTNARKLVMSNVVYAHSQWENDSFDLIGPNVNVRFDDVTKFAANTWTYKLAIRNLLDKVLNTINQETSTTWPFFIFFLSFWCTLLKLNINTTISKYIYLVMKKNTNNLLWSFKPASYQDFS